MNFKRKRDRLNSIFSFLLLFFFSFFLSFPSFHVFSHKELHFEEPCDCSLEVEETECHQFIYHFDGDVECAHEEGHILEKTKQCDLCASLVLLKSFLSKEKELTVKPVENSFSKPFYSKGVFSFYLFDEGVRGPPAMLLF